MKRQGGGRPWRKGRGKKRERDIPPHAGGVVRKRIKPAGQGGTGVLRKEKLATLRVDGELRMKMGIKEKKSSEGKKSFKLCGGGGGHTVRG